MFVRARPQRPPAEVPSMKSFVRVALVAATALAPATPLFAQASDVSIGGEAD
jgi:hypothetical protein